MTSKQTTISTIHSSRNLYSLELHDSIAHLSINALVSIPCSSASLAATMVGSGMRPKLLNSHSVHALAHRI